MRVRFGPIEDVFLQNMNCCFVQNATYKLKSLKQLKRYKDLAKQMSAM